MVVLVLEMLAQLIERYVEFQPFNHWIISEVVKLPPHSQEV
jgi:hypothetical protein